MGAVPQLVGASTAGLGCSLPWDVPCGAPRAPCPPSHPQAPPGSPPGGRCALGGLVLHPAYGKAFVLHVAPADLSSPGGARTVPFAPSYSQGGAHCKKLLLLSKHRHTTTAWCRKFMLQKTTLLFPSAWRQQGQRHIPLGGRQPGASTHGCSPTPRARAGCWSVRDADVMISALHASQGAAGSSCCCLRISVFIPIFWHWRYNDLVL